jgi:hypothetical protein
MRVNLKVVFYLILLSFSLPASAEYQVQLDQLVWNLQYTLYYRAYNDITKPGIAIRYYITNPITLPNGDRIRLELNTETPFDRNDRDLYLPEFTNDSVSFILPPIFDSFRNPYGIVGMKNAQLAVRNLDDGFSSGTRFSYTFNIRGHLDPSNFYCYETPYVVGDNLITGTPFFNNPWLFLFNNTNCQDYDPAPVSFSNFAITLPDPTPSPTPTPSTSPSPIPSPTPSPSPTPTPTPSSTPTPTPTQYAFNVSVKNGPELELIDGTLTAQMKPSISGCGRIPQRSSEKKFLLRCTNKVTGETVSGCRYMTNLMLADGSDAKGGHFHDYDTRPLGDLDLDLNDSNLIPGTGLEFNYFAPEVSGDVNFSLSGTGPNGESVEPFFARFKMREGKYEPIAVDYLDFNIESHPDGNRGTTELTTRLKKAVNLFRQTVEEAKITPVPNLESQSASLPFGGLFDFDYSTSVAWTIPHCSHRDGRRIDLSRSRFSGYPAGVRVDLEKFLMKALRVSKLYFVDEGDHWHVAY